MEEDFEFGSPEEQKWSVDRYEEMLRNQDQYFFDAKAFESIIEYYTDKNDPVKALQVAEYAKSQHPYDSAFLLKKAQLLVRMSQFNKASAELDKATILEPNSGEAFLLKGNIALLQGNIEEGEQLFLYAIELGEDSAEAYLQIAELYQIKGEYEKAIEYLKKSLEANMENDDALHALALCYEIIDRPEESISFYKTYIDSDPYSYAAWFNLGLAYERLSNFEDAIDAYDYAILINESFVPAYFNKGNVLVNLQKYT